MIQSNASGPAKLCSDCGQLKSIDEFRRREATARHATTNVVHASTATRGDIGLRHAIGRLANLLRE